MIHFPHDRTIVAAFDGTNIPMKSADGSTWTQLGIDPPASAPTAANLSGGSLVSGQEYEFSYAYRDSVLGHTGNESEAVSHTPSGTNLSVRLTLDGSDDPQVDTLVVYARNKTAGESVRRQVGTVANPGGGSTATFDVTAPNWETGDEAPTDHTVAVPMRFGVVWRNRWWGVDATQGNRLRFTQIFQPQSWPGLFFIDIPFERGDAIRALVTLGDTLVVFGSVKVFLIIGQTSLDFEVRPSAGAVTGALGPRAVAVIEQGILHASAAGVHVFDGASDRLLSDEINPAWQDAMQRSDADDLAQVALLYHDPRKEVHVAVPRLYPLSTPGEWILDLTRTRLQESPAWTSTTRAIGGYISWDGAESDAGDRGRVFSWGRETGELFEEVTGTDADGEDLVAEYEGPAMIPAPFRTTRFLDVYGEYRPAAGTFGLTVAVDEADVATITIDIGGTLPIYGVATYGRATYGGASRRQFRTNLPLAAEGRSVTLKARYTGRGVFKLYSAAIGIVPEAAIRGI